MEETLIINQNEEENPGKPCGAPERRPRDPAKRGSGSGGDATTALNSLPSIFFGLLRSRPGASPEGRPEA